MDVQNYEKLIQDGENCLAQKDFDTARDLFQEAVKLDPKQVRSYYQLGFVYFQLGELEDAIMQFQQAQKIDPKDPTIYHNLGLIQFKANRLQDAEVSLQKALRLKPDYTDARYTLGKVFFTQERFVEAMDEFLLCSLFDPKNGKYKTAVSDCQSESVIKKHRQQLKNVLIVMDEGIGNMVMLTPTLRAVKEMLPDCQLTVFGRKPSVQIIENWDVVDQIITSPGNQKYDLAFLTIWSNQFLKNYRSWLDRHCKTVIKTFREQSQHESDSYFHIAKCLGYTKDKPETFCSMQPVDLNLSQNKKTVALSDTTLNNGAWERKRWPYYPELARQLMQKGYQVLLVGGKSEAERFQSSGWPDDVINCLGKYSIQETAGLLKQCDLFIGNDSGPAHMAASLNIPTYVFFGSTLISKNLPLGKQVKALSLSLSCSPCQYTSRWNTCTQWRCMSDMTADKVLPVIFEDENKPVEYQHAVRIKNGGQLKLIAKEYIDCRIEVKNNVTCVTKNGVSEPLRIHLVGARRANFPWGMENEILRAMVQAGIEVVDTDYRLDVSDFDSKFLREAHLMLVCKGSGIKPELIKKFPGKTILWYQDDVFTTQHAPRDLAFNGWAYDAVYSFDGSALEQYKKYGIKDVRYLPLAMSPAVHRKMFLPKIHDVAFVGNIHPNRKPFFERLRKRFDVLVKRAFMDEMVTIFNQAKIVLNLGIGPTGIQQRVFEALGCGSLLITNEIPGKDRLFEDKVHLIYFNDNNIEEKIAYYLEHDDERETIAYNGYLEAHRHHTFCHRIDSILNDHFQVVTNTSKRFTPTIKLPQKPTVEASEIQEISGFFESVPCRLCGERGKQIVVTTSGCLRQCHTCGLIYASPRLNKEAMRRQYMGYVPSAFLDEKNRKRKFEEMIHYSNEDIDRIEKYHAPGRILDVGTAAGTFLDCARKRGWKIEGTDLSKAAIKTAKQQYQIELIEGDLLDIQFKEKYYDVISLRHCIEHLMEPVEELAVLHRALKDDGLLFLATPGHAKDLKVLRAKHMLPHHVVNYTRETLNLLLEKTGFREIHFESYIDPGMKIDNMIMVARKSNHQSKNE